MKGKVKTLLFNDLVGYNTDMAVYPVTSVLGVFDENNTDLKTIIANLKKAIENKADSSTVSTSTNFTPVLISQESSTGNPGTPTGGKYNYATKTLTPPDGWTEGGTISTTNYLCMGVANSDTSAITWSEPYNSLTIKGDKGDKGDQGEKGEKGDKGDAGSGGSTTITENVGICYAYRHATSLPDKPTGGTYNASTKTFTVLPSEYWKTSTQGLERPIYMSIGTGHSDGSIEWQTPFLIYSNTSEVFDDVPQSNYATTFCYKESSKTLLTAPTGGTYDFDKGELTEPPSGGWVVSKNNLSAPYYMSIGNVKRDATTNTITIRWSVPIYLTSKDSLSQGETPGSDNLVKAHVVIAYQNKSTTPSTPAATEGSVDFTKDPYTVTPPSGWFITEDDTNKITDDTWCTIKAFYYKEDSDGNNAYAADNNTRAWSDPVKSSEAKVSLSKAELDLVVGKMSITANEIKTAVGTWVMDAEYIKTVAEKISTTTDFYSLVAGKINIQSLDYNLIATNIITVSDGIIDTITTNAAGEIVTEIKQDKDGLLGLFAEKVVLKATNQGNGKGSYIQLLAESASGQVAAQLCVGTNAEGSSFIKAVAKEVNILGLLKTQDISIGNGKSYFYADGSGWIANKNIRWDTDGNLTIKGEGVIGDVIKDISLTADNGYGYKITTDTEGTKTTTMVTIDATEGYSLYNITNTKGGTSTATDSTAMAASIGFIFIEGCSLGKRIKLIVNNTATVGSVLMGSNEGATFVYTSKAGDKFKTIQGGTSGALNGIQLYDGYYELVGIGEKKWMLAVGYGSYYSS